ncbi:hypothetical protein A2U01_0095251, partial [Trifolium medium]|nr:hypothetical protein [Trifolium medium]
MPVATASLVVTRERIRRRISSGKLSIVTTAGEIFGGRISSSRNSTRLCAARTER